MYFPSVHVENFFENPYRVIDYAKSLPFNKKENQTYPGLRTPPLHELNFDFFNDLCLRQLSIFYTQTEMESVQFNCTAYFQLINQDTIPALVHTDDSILTTIVYLTPGEEHSGTSIVAPTEKNDSISQTKYKKFEAAQNLKMEAVHNPENIDMEKAIEASHKFNNEFKEITRFNSVFNSLSMFNSTSCHKAHFNPNGGERLTLICFYYDILAPRFPIPQMSRMRL